MNKLDVSNSFLSCSENDSPITLTVSGIECGALNRTAILTRYGRRYVIKGLKKEYQDSAVHRTQLRKEFDIVSSLDHRSIAKAFTIERIEDFGEAIVMEYVDGMTLGRWLSGDTTASQRLRVAQEIIEAMAYVHSTGISHRDLKPDNIMIARAR